MAIGAIRPIDDRRKAWQAVVAVAVADVTALATGNGGRQAAGGERKSGREVGIGGTRRRWH